MMVCVSDCFVRACSLRVMVCGCVFRLLCQASCTVGARRPSTWTGVWLCFPLSICVCERGVCVCVCVCETQRERGVCVCVRETGRERGVSVCERERGVYV